MSLAENIRAAGEPELNALATYLIGEFEMKGPDVTNGEKRPADARSVTAALAAWAYMQLHAQDQGD